MRSIGPLRNVSPAKTSATQTDPFSVPEVKSKSIATITSTPNKVSTAVQTTFSASSHDITFIEKIASPPAAQSSSSKPVAKAPASARSTSSVSTSSVVSRKDSSSSSANHNSPKQQQPQPDPVPVKAIEQSSTPTSASTLISASSRKDRNSSSASSSANHSSPKQQTEYSPVKAIEQPSTQKAEPISRPQAVATSLSNTSRVRARGVAIDSLMTLFSPKPSSSSISSSLSPSLLSPTKPSIAPAVVPKPTSSGTNATAAKATTAAPEKAVKATRSGRQPMPTNRLVDEINSSTSLAVENDSPVATETSRKRARPTKESTTKPTASQAAASTSTSSEEWLPQEFTALYTAYGKTEVDAPDFWSQVAVELAALGIHKTAKQCQDRWFLSLQEAEKRRQKKLASSSVLMNTTSASSSSSSKMAVTSEAVASSSSLYSLEDNKFQTKKKKLTKTAMKVSCKVAAKGWLLSFD
jgi:trimeric autotransporter adhesin